MEPSNGLFEKRHWFSQGSTYVAPNGAVMCQLCFAMTDHDDLEPVSDEPGKVWDVCKYCAEVDRADGGTY